MKSVSWTWLLIGLAGGMVAGYFTVAGFFDSSAASGANAECHKDFALTSPEIDCDYDNVLARLRALDATLKQATDEYVKQGKATRVSVWVRDFNSRQWAASNETETYSPASLLKLPLMIVYYKYAELDPSILRKSVVYKTPDTLNDSYLNFTQPTSLVVGQSYTVEQLLDKMMIDSDNGASLTLYRNVDSNFYNKTLVDLGISIPNAGSDPLDYITVKSYANIFRNLYNASYLNREYSQKALELMSHSAYKGIAAPLPDSTIVAHKFGERSVVQPDGSVSKRELHDCGVVYKENTPYSLCIMTEGTDFDDLESVIEGISAVAYQNM